MIRSALPCRSSLFESYRDALTFAQRVLDRLDIASSEGKPRL
jgi:hypothetical protein